MGLAARAEHRRLDDDLFNGLGMTYRFFVARLHAPILPHSRTAGTQKWRKKCVVNCIIADLRHKNGGRVKGQAKPGLPRDSTSRGAAEAHALPRAAPWTGTPDACSPTRCVRHAFGT